MLRISFAVVFAVGAVFGEPAQTQTQALETAGPSDSARYSFYRQGESFLRFDVQTGQVADCGWTASGWFCRMAPDERTALEAEIARLYEINIALKKSLLAHGVPLPDGIIAPPGTRSFDDRLRWPNAADVDRVTTAVGELWRRMVQTMANLQRGMLRKT